MKTNNPKPRVSTIGLQFFAGNRLAEIEQRLSAIRTELDAEGADLDALDQEVQQLTEERTRLLAEAERRRNLLNSIGDGSEGRETRGLPGMEPPVNVLANPYSSPEYRRAWLNNLRGVELSAVERRAFTTAAESAGAVVPTQTENQILTKVTQYAPLLGKITLLRVPGSVEFPVEDEYADAAKHAEMAEITPEDGKLSKITLNAYEITKLVQISKSVKLMAIDAFENWLTDMIAKKLAKQITGLILTGSGKGEGMGIETGVTWGDDNLITVAAADSLTAKNVLDAVALLPGGYDAEAEWLMSKKTLISDFMPLQDKSKNDLVVQEGKQYYVAGYPVTLDERVTTHEAYLGALPTIIGNMPEEANITSDFDVKHNAFLFLGCAMFDCKPTFDNAFVKIAKGTA